MLDILFMNITRPSPLLPAPLLYYPPLSSVTRPFPLQWMIAFYINTYRNALQYVYIRSEEQEGCRLSLDNNRSKDARNMTTVRVSVASFM